MCAPLWPRIISHYSQPDRRHSPNPPQGDVVVGLGALRQMAWRDAGGGNIPIFTASELSHLRDHHRAQLPLTLLSQPRWLSDDADKKEEADSETIMRITPTTVAEDSIQ